MADKRTLADRVIAAPADIAEFACRGVADKAPPVSDSLTNLADGIEERSDLARVVGWFAVVAAIVFLGVGEIFTRSLHVPDAANYTARGALVVCAGFFYAFAIGVINAGRVHRGDEPLELGVPPEANPWLIGLLAIAAGWLIGTTLVV